MKDEVYSWRLSSGLKTSLEREARRRRISMSAALEFAAREWLGQSGSQNEDEEEQRRMHKAASKWVGAFSGDDPHRAENAARIVRQRLRQRYGR